VIDFRPLSAADLDLVREWLGREHVHRWWRDPVDQDLAEIAAALEGRGRIEYYVILVDARPAGMIQTYRVADHLEWDAIVQAGPGAAGLDLFIGELDLVGRGLGPQILAGFASTVVFADPELVAVVATVEEPNRRSWRAFEKAGFRHVRDVEEDGLPHRLMRLDRARVES
jgi:aminoglycoside 6'-N-acetyltransferase